MARIAQPVTSDFNFKVEKTPLFTRDGKPTTLFATQRVDTGEVLASVSDSYGVVQNEDAVSAIEDGFISAGLTNFERSAYVLRGGAALQMRYDFKDHQIKVPKVKDVLGLRITMKNSFDGSSPLSFEVGYLRLVCTNGMVSMIKEFSLMKKHFGQINMDLIKGSLKDAIEKAHSGVEIFGKMAAIRLDHDRGNLMLERMSEKKMVSGKIVEGVSSLWNTPTYREDQSRSLYSLYNAFTQHLTHGVERMNRFEMAQRETSKITPFFAKLAREPKEIEALVLPA